MTASDGKPEGLGRTLGSAAAARQAYVAVETRNGPHVTPVLFAVTADRLWFVIPRRALKARVLRRRPGVGVLVEDGSRAFVVAGEASLLDPLRPLGLAARLSELARTPVAMPWFGLQNSAELLAYPWDAIRAPGRVMPSGMLLVSVRPEGVEALPGLPDEPGTGATARADRGALAEWDGPLAGVPREAARLARRRGRAVLGWQTATGPCPVPARWDPERGRALVPWEALDRAGAAWQAPACLCLDDSDRRGPLAKTGLLLRGGGRVSAPADEAWVTIEPDRVTYWKGFETGTVRRAGG